MEISSKPAADIRKARQIELHYSRGPPLRTPARSAGPAPDRVRGSNGSGPPRRRNRHRSPRQPWPPPAAARRWPPAGRPEYRAATPAAARNSASPMLSSRMSVAPASRAWRTWASVSHSTSRGRPGAAARTAATAAATPPAAATWLSLIRAASTEPHPVVDAAAAPHGVLLQLAQSRRGLPGVTHGAPGPGQRVRPRPRRGGDSRQVGKEVQHGPLGAQQFAERAPDPQHASAPGDPVTVGAPRLGGFRRDAGRVQDRESDREARQHAWFPGHDGGDRLGTRCGRRGRGDVGAVAEVLRQGAADEPPGVFRIQSRGDQPPGDRRVRCHAPAPTPARTVPAGPAGLGPHHRVAGPAARPGRGRVPPPVAAAALRAGQGGRRDQDRDRVQVGRLGDREGQPPARGRGLVQGLLQAFQARAIA